MQLDGRDDGVIEIEVGGDTESWVELSGTPATPCIVLLEGPVVDADAASISTCPVIVL